MSRPAVIELPIVDEALKDVVNKWTRGRKTIIESREVEKRCWDQLPKLKDLDRMYRYFSEINVRFFKIYPYISKTVMGRCILPTGYTSIFGGVDAIIEMSGKPWDRLTEKSRDLVSLHEMLHIMIREADDDVDEMFQVSFRPHDVQDFGYMIKNHGINYLEEAVVASEVSEMFGAKV